MEKNAHMKKIGSRRAGHFRLAAWPAVAVAGAIAIPTAIAIAIFSQSAIAATAPVGLGTAGSYAVLAGSTVTNTGPSVISGNLGVSPGTAVTGFPPGTVNSGTIHTAAAAASAQADLTTAYNDAAGRVKSASVSAFIGAGQTLAPGVYNATSSLEVGGRLTLNAHGDPNAVWIFQAASTLITDSASSVILTGDAQACNVFWQVGSSATLGTGSAFQGNILALTSITVTTGDTITGRALARNGAVTLDDDTIIVPSCTTGTGPTATGTSPTATGTGPTPTGTSTGPTPTGTGTSTGPTPTDTSTGPTPTGTGTSTGPTPTGTYTGPTPNVTYTGPTPNVTYTGPTPTPTPTGTSPTPTGTTPAPIPTPVGTPFPVTG